MTLSKTKDRKRLKDTTDFPIHMMAAELMLVFHSLSKHIKCFTDSVNKLASPEKGQIRIQ